MTHWVFVWPSFLLFCSLAAALLLPLLYCCMHALVVKGYWDWSERLTTGYTAVDKVKDVVSTKSNNSIDHYIYASFHFHFFGVFMFLFPVQTMIGNEPALQGI